eukprot:g20287.t1
MSSGAVDLDPVTNLPVAEGANSSSSAPKSGDVVMFPGDNALDGAAELGIGIADGAANGNNNSNKRKAAASEIKVDPTGGAGSKKKRPRNQAVERSVAHVASCKAAIWTAMQSRVKNKKGSWKEFSADFLKRASIPDERMENGPDSMMTPVDYIVWKFSAAHRRTFKNFTLSNEQWDDVTEKLNAARKKMAEQLEGKVRDCVAEILGTETVEKSTQKATEFNWKHAEALTEQQDNAGLGGAGASANGQQLAAPAASLVVAAPADLPNGNMLMLPSQSGSTRGSQSEVSYDDLSPGTRLMFEQASTVLDNIDNPQAVAAPESIGFAELTKPLTPIEVGDFENKVGLLGVLARIPVESSTEGVRSLCAVVKAGKAAFGSGHDLYGKSMPKAARKMVAARVQHLQLTTADLVARFSDQLEIVAPKTLECARFIISKLNGDILKMTDEEAPRARSLIAAAEIPALFVSYKTAIVNQAAEHERTAALTTVLRKLFGENGKVNTAKAIVDDVNKEMEELVNKMRANSTEGLAGFYAELIPATLKAGGKVSDTWFKDVFVLKKRDAPAVPEQLKAVKVFQDLAHARTDAKTALQHLVPDDASTYFVLKKLQKLKVPELAHDIKAMEMECDGFDEKNRKILVAAVEVPFLIPQDKWKYGSKYDTTAEQMGAFFKMSYHQRKVITDKAANGDECAQIVADFATRVATRNSVTKKTLPLMLKQFITLVDAQEKLTTEQGIASAEEFMKKVRLGCLYLREDHDLKYMKAATLLAALQAKHADSKSREKAIQKGLLKAAKGNAG